MSFILPPKFEALDRARKMLTDATSDRLDAIAAHDCGVSQVALASLEALRAVVTEIDEYNATLKFSVGPIRFELVREGRDWSGNALGFVSDQYGRSLGASIVPLRDGRFSASLSWGDDFDASGEDCTPDSAMRIALTEFLGELDEHAKDIAGAATVRREALR